MKIARRFNAGWCGLEITESRRDERRSGLRVGFSAVRDLSVCSAHPALKRRAIFTVSLRDKPLPEFPKGINPTPTRAAMSRLASLNVRAAAFTEENSSSAHPHK